MANETRTVHVMVRMTPSMKAASEKAAKDDARTLSSLIEKLLTGHLKANGYLAVEKPHTDRIAQGALDAIGMAHSAIDKALRHSTEVTPGQCRAARALADISQAQLAGIAVVPRAIIEEFEAGVATPSEDDLAAMRRALEWADVEFTNGEGPGVRLRDSGGTAAADRLNASNDE
jgi:hypothetical protein